MEDREPTWREANDIVIAMAAAATTARLNQRQRQALLIVLGLLDRSRQTRQTQEQELRTTHAERKRLRKALNDMREECDRERKRADQAAQSLRLSQRKGRPGCGKIPLGTAAEAHLFIQLRCAATGEDHGDYATYTCERGCVLSNGMAGVWHIGHVVSRAERERRAAENGQVVRRLTDYDAAASHLGIAEVDDDQKAWEERWEAMTPAERAHEIRLMDEYDADKEDRKSRGEAP